LEKGKPQEAAAILGVAKHRYELGLGPKDAKVAEVLQELARVKRMEKKVNEAEYYDRRAKQLLARQ